MFNSALLLFNMSISNSGIRIFTFLVFFKKLFAAIFASKSSSSKFSTLENSDVVSIASKRSNLDSHH